MNIILLEHDETFIKNITPESLEITETAKKGEIRKIKFKYYIQDDITKEIDEFITGNKIFIMDSKTLKDCLYVINGQITDDVWVEGYIEGIAEEVLVELNYLPPISQNDIIAQSPEEEQLYGENERVTGHFNITKERLEQFFDTQYNIGTVNVGLSSNTAQIKGVMSCMEVLRLLEKQTGNIFETEYQIAEDGFTIIRTLHFLNPKNIGEEIEHVFDVNRDMKNFRYSVDETKAFTAVAPRIKAQNDETDEKLADLIKDYKNLEIIRNTLIPHSFSKEHTNSYMSFKQTEREIKQNGSLVKYWSRTMDDGTYYWCPEPLTSSPEFIKKYDAETLLNNKDNIKAKSKQYFRYLSNTDKGDTFNTIKGTVIDLKTGDIIICYGEDFRIHRQQDRKELPDWQNVKSSFVYATSIIPAPFTKLKNSLVVEDTAESNYLTYDNIYSRDDYKYLNISEEDPQGNLEDDAGSIRKTGFFEVDKGLNSYEIYDKLCIHLRENRKPKIEAQGDVYDEKANQINLYDNLFLKLNGFNDILFLRVVKTEKYLHTPDKTKIELQYDSLNGMISLENSHIVTENITVNHTGDYNITGRLITMKEVEKIDSEGKEYYEYEEKPITNRLISVSQKIPEKNITNVIKIVKREAKYKYDEYGRTPDLKYIRAIGLRSNYKDKVGTRTAAADWWDATFLNRCPNCYPKRGDKSLYWSIKPRSNTYNPIKQRNTWYKPPIVEGMITCGLCSADWSVQGNNLLPNGKGRKLTVINKPKRIKGKTGKGKNKKYKGRALAEKLQAGEMPYAGSSTTVSDVSYEANTSTIPESYMTGLVKTDKNGYFSIKARLNGSTEDAKPYEFTFNFAGDNTYAACSATSYATPRKHVPTTNELTNVIVEDNVQYITTKPIKRTGGRKQAPALTNVVISTAKKWAAGKEGIEAAQAIAEKLSDKKELIYGNRNGRSYSNFIRSPTAVLTKKNRKGQRYANCCDTTCLYLSLLEALNLSRRQDKERGFLLQYAHSPNHVYAIVDGTPVDCILKKQNKKTAWGHHWGKRGAYYKTEHPNLPFGRSY